MTPAFWRQPNAAFRDFQLLFALLTLHFFLPACSYLLAPQTAIAQFSRLGTALGGGDYPLQAAEAGYVWLILAAANVMTLSFMCLLLLIDLRRYFPVLTPLVFLKGFTALAYFGVFLAAGRYPAFLAVALYDAFNVALMLLFAVRARRALELVPGVTLSGAAYA